MSIVTNYLYRILNTVQPVHKTKEHSEQLYKRLREAGILSNQKNIERFLTNNLVKGSDLEHTLREVGIA